MVAIKDRETQALKAAVKRMRAARAMSIMPAAFMAEEARHYIGGVSARSLLRLCERGLIKPRRVLRHLIFPREELDRFLRDTRQHNGATKRRAA
jgi:hypothetical protein